ncbi:MAG: sigma-70 family RNA polymerase sigma factor [Clostridiales bacterium]|nr:sigma-70 family RNA polymerase sigma factor [Clostridiales bacterium]
MLLVLTFSTEQERDKFEYLFNQYKRLMLHKAYGILHDYALAEDAASEAFLRVYKNLHRIDDPKSPRSVAFLVTIVKNVSLTILQKQRKHNTADLDMDLDGGFDLEEHTISQMNADYIYESLSQLSEDTKGVFLLKYKYDLSHTEIGEILGMSENNVTVRLHRAKKKLKDILRGEVRD